MATREGTERFAKCFPGAASNGFFREANDWRVSSIGLGSYLGDLSEQTDVGYYSAVLDAAAGGINVLDTAINYRHQRSEQVIGSALRRAFRDGMLARDEVVVCTKAGYLTPGAIPEGPAGTDDVVRGIHCMAPDFLQDQLARSRENLGLETIDVHYLHNPETQLGEVEPEEFARRIRWAFEALEACCSRGWIQAYGTATWDGYRRRDGAAAALQLAAIAGIAREVAGDAHHFRFIQLPFNLAMTEAYAVPNQGLEPDRRTVLDVAAELGVQVVGSASILQSRLSRNLPEPLRAAIPEAETDAQRALQFARSAPGICTALVGMSSRAHVAENLALTRFVPLPEDRFRQLL